MEDPWESCITMGNSWSYVPNDHYKSASQLIGLLVKIVSRGGNLLLNVGPSPDGEWDDTAYSRLQEIGAWMKINSEGIYNSKPCRPYTSGNNICLTQSKDETAIYAFVTEDQVTLPSEISIDGLKPAHIGRITLLGYKNSLKWKQDGGKLIILVPPALQNKVVGQHAVTFKIVK